MIDLSLDNSVNLGLIAVVRWIQKNRSGISMYVLTNTSVSTREEEGLVIIDLVIDTPKTNEYLTFSYVPSTKEVILKSETSKRR